MFLTFTFHAIQRAAVTCMLVLLLAFSALIRENVLALLEDLSNRPTFFRLSMLKRYIQDYILDTDGDESAATAATESDESVCAEGVDFATLSIRAVSALDSIESLGRLANWQEQAAELYDQVALNFKQEILTNAPRPSHRKLSSLTSDNSSDNVIHRARPA